MAMPSMPSVSSPQSNYRSTSTPVLPPESTSDSGRNMETNLFCISFNQDFGCFACGTNQGFRIYNCEPFRETFKRDFGNGGIGLVEMLFRSNILAFVGAEGNPQFPPTNVIIWDDHGRSCIGEVTFRSKIRAVKLRRDLLVVVLEHLIFVYKLQGLKLLYQIETLANPKGLCVLSQASNTSVLACPGLHRGEVRVEHYGLKRTRFIPVHDSHIACFTLTLDGILLATASTKGTLVRIFNTFDGTLLQEVRRGTERAEIYSIALSPSAQWLAVSSDKGTVHIFGLKVQVAGEVSSNVNVNTMEQLPGLANLPDGSNEIILTPNTGAKPSSSLDFMKGILPKYFSSEWSFARYHLPENTRFHIAFGKQNTVMIVGMDGSFYRCAFDPINGGEMTKKEHVSLLESDKASAK
ncbi:hypothetical protein SUGI_0945510 [Cryptomeria japonica]|uniref:autophagy-related protein 18c n=1 Tax=Cryptomeria japonica TaxID=3369 RepID=UPI0024147EDD|nr:autophagy-related protein 18c [Cryptomeria japonica]XP_057836726.1 autophagy-related protein 18c [Cryptomeria japonica]GLJ44910.1 hypothetical protein SUGI_0945510 [Cryptomeria japonica]